MAVMGVWKLIFYKVLVLQTAWDKLEAANE